MESSYKFKDTGDTDSKQEHENSTTCSYEYNAQGNPISCSQELVSDGDIDYIDVEIAYDEEDMIQSLHVQKAEEASETEAAFLVFTYSESGSLTSLAIADGDYGSPDEVEGYDLVLSYSYDEDWNLTEISSSEDYGGNLDSSMIQYALLALGDTRSHRQVVFEFTVMDYSRITIEYDESGNQTQIYVQGTDGKRIPVTFRNYGSEKKLLQTDPAVEEITDSRDRVIKRILWYDADSWEDADRYMVTYFEYE